MSRHAVYLPGYIYWSASWSLFAHKDIFVSLSDTNMAADRWVPGSNATAPQVSNGERLDSNRFNLYDELCVLIASRRCATFEARTRRWRHTLPFRTSPAQWTLALGILRVHINIEQIHYAGGQSTNHVTELIPFYLVAGHAFNWLLCAVRTRLWDWITWHRQPQRRPLYNDRADPLPSVLPTGEALGVVLNNLNYFTRFLVKTRQPFVHHRAVSEVRAA